MLVAVLLPAVVAQRAVAAGPTTTLDVYARQLKTPDTNEIYDQSGDLKQAIALPAGPINDNTFADAIADRLCKRSDGQGQTYCLYVGAFILSGVDGSKHRLPVKAVSWDDSHDKVVVTPDVDATQYPDQAKVELSMTKEDFKNRFILAYISSYDYYVVDYLLTDAANTAMKTFTGVSMSNRRQILSVQYGTIPGAKVQGRYGLGQVVVRHDRSLDNTFVKDDDNKFANVSVVRNPLLDNSTPTETYQTLGITVTGEAHYPIPVHVDTPKKDGNMKLTTEAISPSGHDSTSGRTANINGRPPYLEQTGLQYGQTYANSVYYPGPIPYNSTDGKYGGVNWFLSTVTVNKETFSVPFPAQIEKKADSNADWRNLWNATRTSMFGSVSSTGRKLLASKTFIRGENAGSSVNVYLTGYWIANTGSGGAAPSSNDGQRWTCAGTKPETSYQDQYKYQACYLYATQYEVEIVGLKNSDTKISVSYSGTANSWAKNQQSLGFTTGNTDADTPYDDAAVQVWAGGGAGGDLAKLGWNTLCSGEAPESATSCVHSIKHPDVPSKDGQQRLLVRLRYMDGFGPAFNNSNKTGGVCPDGSSASSGGTSGGPCNGVEVGGKMAALWYQKSASEPSWVAATEVAADAVPFSGTGASADDGWIYYVAPFRSNRSMSSSLSYATYGSWNRWWEHTNGSLALGTVQSVMALSSPFFYNVTIRSSADPNATGYGIPDQTDLNFRQNSLFGISQRVPTLGDDAVFLGYKLYACGQGSSNCQKVTKKPDAGSSNTAATTPTVYPGEVIELSKWNIPWTVSGKPGVQNTFELRLVPNDQRDDDSVAPIVYSAQQRVVVQGDSYVDHLFSFQAIDGMTATWWDGKTTSTRPVPTSLTYKATDVNLNVEGSTWKTILSPDAGKSPSGDPVTSGYVEALYQDTPATLRVNLKWQVGNGAATNTAPAGITATLHVNARTPDWNTDLTGYGHNQTVTLSATATRAATAKCTVTSVTYTGEDVTTDTEMLASASTVTLKKAAPAVNTYNAVAHVSCPQVGLTLTKTFDARTNGRRADHPDWWNLDATPVNDPDGKPSLGEPIAYQKSGDTEQLDPGMYALTATKDSKDHEDDTAPFVDATAWTCENATPQTKRIGSKDYQVIKLTSGGAAVSCSLSSSVDELTMLVHLPGATSGTTSGGAAILPFSLATAITQPDNWSLTATDSKGTASSVTGASTSSEDNTRFAKHGETYTFSETAASGSWVWEAEYYTGTDAYTDAALSDDSKWTDVPKGGLTLAENNTRYVVRLTNAEVAAPDLPLTGGHARDTFWILSAAGAGFAALLTILARRRRARADALAHDDVAQAAGRG